MVMALFPTELYRGFEKEDKNRRFTHFTLFEYNKAFLL